MSTVLPGRSRPPPLRRGHPPPAVGAASAPTTVGTTAPAACVRGVGAERAARSRSSATGTAGTAACTRCDSMGPTGIWGRSSPRRRARAALQVRDRHGRRPDAAARPIRWRARPRLPPSNASVVPPSHARLGRRRLDGPPAQRRSTATSRCAIYEVHLGSWRAQACDVPATLAAAARRPRRPPRLHPRRAAAGRRASRSAARGATRSPATTRRPRASALPTTSACFVDIMHQRGIGVILDWVPAHFPKDEWASAASTAPPLYEHPDPRPGRAPGLGHVRLQLRPQRGAQLPRGQRALLARRVPHRRAARRRRRVDAVPRLLPQAGRVGAERVRRPGEPRRDRASCAR